MLESLKIKLHQSLHGYADGHTLLAASCEINTSAAARSLAIMSDLSGPSISAGFEQYLTGYPIPSMQMYALGKTWYAKEMPRPGCVYTHTLLISMEDLDLIPKLADLLSIFERPSGNNFSHYQSPIYLPIQDLRDVVSASKSNYFEQSEIEMEVVRALFSDPESSIFVPSSNSSRFESLSLNIWQNQWKSLKCSFSFTTGALALRYHNGKLLDLQIGPDSGFSQNSSGERAQKIQSSTVGSPEKSPSWLFAIASSLLNRSNDFLKFLKDYGQDIRGQRSAMPAVASSFLLLSLPQDKQQHHRQLIQFLGTYFPSSDEAKTIKFDLLAQPIHGSNTQDQKREFEILFELSITNLSEAFDYDQLRYRNRMSFFLQQDLEAGISFIEQLTTSGLNLHGAKSVAEYLEQIAQDHWQFLNQSHRRIFLILLSITPELAYRPAFWSGERNTQQENFDQLAKISLKNPIEWRKVFDTILEAKAPISEESWVELDIDPATYILEWLSSNPSRTLSEESLQILSRSPEKIIDWLEKSDVLTHGIYNAIPKIFYHSQALMDKVSISLWEKITAPERPFSKEASLSFKGFILTIALKRDTPKVFGLLAFSFEPIYFAQLNQKLDYEIWRKIEPLTPSLPFYKDWDKCKKLRKALAERFIKYKWPVLSLKSITNDRDLAKDVIDRYKQGMKD